jgi:hypothetical protein
VPFVREMARSDLVVLRSEESMRQNLGLGARVTRRSFKALGARQRYLDSDPEEILNTGSSTWILDENMSISS